MNIRTENERLKKLKKAEVGDVFLIGGMIYTTVPSGWEVEGTFVPNPDIYKDLRNRMDVIDDKLEALLDKR